MTAPLRFMRKLSDKGLQFGVEVRLFLRDGTELLGHCTLITTNDGQFTQWYNSTTRKGVDRTQIAGWLPKQQRDRL